MLPVPHVPAWAALGLVVALAGACAGAAGPGADGAAPAPPEDGERPTYTERLTYELDGIPGAGIVQVFQMRGELDVEYTLFSQRLRWSASAPPGPIEARGLGWADYRGRCERPEGAAPDRGGGPHLRCMAPFDYFFPLPDGEGGQCYTSIDLERDICPDRPEAHRIMRELFELGGELARHVTTGESFAPYRERLRNAFQDLLELREMLDGGDVSDSRAGEPQARVGSGAPGAPPGTAT